MVKKMLIISGVIVLLMSASVAIAAKPESFQTWATNQINALNASVKSLGDRLTLVETAVTGQTSDIQDLHSRVEGLESNQNQPKPDFNLIIDTTPSLHFTGNSPVDLIYLDTRVKTDIGEVYEPGYGNISDYLKNAAFWATVHTPDANVKCKVRYVDDGYTEWGHLVCRMPGGGYQYGTPITADVFAEWGGKVAQKTITIDTNAPTP